MENKQKRRSRNDNRHNKVENSNKYDSLLKKTIGFISTYILIIFVIIIVFSLTGCTNYKEEYVNELVKNQELQSKIKESTCPKCEIKTVEKVIERPCNYTTTINQSERQRYTIRIKELEWYLSKLNNTKELEEIKNNLTTCESTKKENERKIEQIYNITK